VLCLLISPTPSRPHAHIPSGRIVVWAIAIVKQLAMLIAGQCFVAVRGRSVLDAA
jgi:hypothetical protein